MRALALAGFAVLAACGPGVRKPHEALTALRSGLQSTDAPARAKAAWDMGQLGMAEFPDGKEPATFVTLREAAAADLAPVVLDPEPSVRRAAVEALGKVGGTNAEETLLAAGTDVDPGVRGETALALFRRRFLKHVPDYSTATVNRLIILASDPDSEVRWKAVYAFTRFPDTRALNSLVLATKDADKVTRLFAVRALSKQNHSVDVKLLSDPDIYVRAEAVGSYGSAKAAGELPSSLYNDPSSHVRSAIADAVAATGRPDLAGPLEKMADTDGPLPAGRALLALAKLRGDSEAARLERARRDPRWWVRSKAYEASSFLKDAPAILDAGVRDADARVAAQALETLAASTSPLAAAAISRVLMDPKSPLEVLGTAIDAAAERKTVWFAAPLKIASKRRDLTAELGDSLLKALAASGAPAKSVGPALEAPKVFPPLTVTPVIVMETEKGTVEIELDPSAAPNHAAAIATMVRGGLYDGLIWHRVVTAFVVQGGDPRGSGWGDAGYRLKDEVNRRPFRRGTLGMPKAGPDTGGCQLFVSLVPTPHLDGRYTAFGRVITGMDAIDALQPGDKIIKARLR